MSATFIKTSDSKRQKLSHVIQARSDARLSLRPVSFSVPLLLPGVKLHMRTNENTFSNAAVATDQIDSAQWSSPTASTSSFHPPPMSPAAYRNKCLSVVIKGACAKGDHPYETFLKWCFERVASAKSSGTMHLRRPWWQAVLYVESDRNELQGGDLVKAIADEIVKLTQRPDTQHKIITHIFKDN